MGDHAAIFRNESLNFCYSLPVVCNIYVIYVYYKYILTKRTEQVDNNNALVVKQTGASEKCSYIYSLRFLSPADGNKR